MLTFSFEELEKALGEIAASKAQRKWVGPLVSSLRNQYEGSSDRLSLLDQMLVAAWLIQNEDGEQVIEEVKATFKVH
ncbi:MAG: hypothetical protein ACYDD1_14110 [Caulobacteraceae bacterium]